MVTRRWSAAQVKEGIADADVTPARRGRRRSSARPSAPGWSPSSRSSAGDPQAVEGGFAAGQPQYNFWIPLAGRTEDDVLKGMNQQWRRNIKKADEGGGRGPSRRRRGADLKAFHDLYVHTAGARRLHPAAAGLLRGDVRRAAAPRTPTGSGSGSPATRATWSPPRSRSGSATHAWYSYGASSTEKRDVRGSNAIQWEMIRDALAAGAEVYDLRGITDTLDSDDPHVGLIQFKVGTGGEAVEYAGEWDLPLHRPLYRALRPLHERRRG